MRPDYSEEKLSETSNFPKMYFILNAESSYFRCHGYLDIALPIQGDVNDF